MTHQAKLGLGFIIFGRTIPCVVLAVVLHPALDHCVVAASVDCPSVTRPLSYKRMNVSGR